jgi:hypothetical protein
MEIEEYFQVYTNLNRSDFFQGIGLSKYTKDFELELTTIMLNSVWSGKDPSFVAGFQYENRVKSLGNNTKLFKNLVLIWM